MKLNYILALLSLSAIAKGTWLVAAVQPFIVSLAAVWAAIDLDVLDVQPIEWKSWLPFINK